MEDSPQGFKRAPRTVDQIAGLCPDAVVLARPSSLPLRHRRRYGLRFERGGISRVVGTWRNYRPALAYLNGGFLNTLMNKSMAIWLLILLFVGSSQLATAQTTFQIRCHGSAGMASVSGKNLIVDFRPGDHPAGQALGAGQCSWLDRGLNANEPTRIVKEYDNVRDAQNAVKSINSGYIWTFWVFNVGRFFHATEGKQGSPIGTPQHIDHPQ